VSGISPASAVIEARAALHAAADAALVGDDDVDVYPGFTWPIAKNAWVALTRTSTETDPATFGPKRSQEEKITFHMSIGAWVPGHDASTSKAAFDRAFGILSLIQNHIRVNDITLGDTVMWCLPGPVESDGIADAEGDGYVAEIDASFICKHRIQTA